MDAIRESPIVPKISPSSTLENTVVINRAGVVNLGFDRGFIVNDEAVIDLIRNGVDELKPKKDYNGSFAAKVCVVVQLIGDMNVEVSE